MGTLASQETKYYSQIRSYLNIIRHERMPIDMQLSKTVGTGLNHVWNYLKKELESANSKSNSKGTDMKNLKSLHKICLYFMHCILQWLEAHHRPQSTSFGKETLKLMEEISLEWISNISNVGVMVNILSHRSFAFLFCFALRTLLVAKMRAVGGYGHAQVPRMSYVGHSPF